MANLYRQAISDSRFPERIRREQRDWLNGDRNTCRSEKCLLITYGARIESLQSESSHESRPYSLGYSDSEAWEGEWAHDKNVCKNPENSDDPNAGIWTITRKELTTPEETCEVKQLQRNDEVITMHLNCSMEGVDYNDKQSFFVKGDKLQFISGKRALVRCK